MALPGGAIVQPRTFIIFAAKMPRNPRYRRYALTFFDKPDFVFDENIVRYFVSGMETCPETKRVHYQSYIELFKPTTLSKLKEIVDDAKVHAEPCKGQPSQNVAYCKKDGNVYREEGTISKPGKRNDLVALRDHFREKKDLRSAIENDDLLLHVAKHPRLVNTLQLLYSVERSHRTKLFVFWGPPGTGKSHTAHERASKLGTVYYKPSGAWWDGYEGQDSVIFEDFRGETGLAQLLRLADKYPLQVPVKGGFRQFTSARIFITSNLDIDGWFNPEQRGYEVSISALKRRITQKVHFDKLYEKEKEEKDCKVIE